jgi:molybdopterin-guanine dinucleotide biosynthesis adapter protein
MIPIVSFVGWSGSGKTTLLEKLIPELVRRGYRVATVKHDVHGFEMDREGKDTWRHRKAGSYCTMISSATRLAMVRDMDHDASLEEIRERFVSDVDILLAEGFKTEPVPKIEVFRTGVHPGPMFADHPDLVALVSDKAFATSAPVVGLEDAAGLANIIEDRFLRK